MMMDYNSIVTSISFPVPLPNLFFFSLFIEHDDLKNKLTIEWSVKAG